MKPSQTSNVRLDDTVLLTIILSIVVAVLTLAFKAVNKKPCIPFRVSVEAPNYYTGQNINFSIDLKSFDKIEWSFGDGTKSTFDAGRTYHSFKTPGIYNISAMVNGSCRETVSLKISKAPIIVDTTLTPNFEWPRTATVGVPVAFADHSKNADQWEWRFGETVSVDATDSRPTYTFKSPGPKTISVVVNGDPNRMKSVTLYVNPAKVKIAPSQNGGSGRGIIIVDRAPRSKPLNSDTAKVTNVVVPPVVPNAPNGPNVSNVKNVPKLTNEQVEEMLRNIADHSMKMNYFSKYLQNGEETSVFLNGNLTTFKGLYQDLNNIKSSSKIKTLKVQTTTDATNHIKTMNVELKTKKGFLGL